MYMASVDLRGTSSNAICLGPSLLIFWFTRRGDHPPPTTFQHQCNGQKTRKRTRSDVMLYQNQQPTITIPPPPCSSYSKFKYEWHLKWLSGWHSEQLLEWTLEWLLESLLEWLLEWFSELLLEWLSEYYLRSQLPKIRRSQSPKVSSFNTLKLLNLSRLLLKCKYIPLIKNPIGRGNTCNFSLFSPSMKKFQ